MHFYSNYKNQLCIKFTSKYDNYNYEKILYDNTTNFQSVVLSGVLNEEMTISGLNKLNSYSELEILELFSKLGSNTLCKIKKISKKIDGRSGSIKIW